ncbi:MAG: 16S rRNA (cytosine(967)-C(5))-methyltransferase RsmB [Firmicutes bacterium]|nr:16S rRNA (cytosine(967)-C(5))-methyltransferase RsmB [Bacillota bacterium]
MDRDRRLAYLALREIESEGSYSNLALNRLFSQETASSQSFVRELVYGVLRNERLLDWNVARYLKKPGLGRAERILLRMGFYQAAMMDGVSPYAAVNETVTLAKSFIRGREGFVNAVLRSFVRDGAALSFPEGGDPAEELCVRYSFAPWIAELWISQYGMEAAEALMAASCTPAPLVIRPNRLRTDRDGLTEILGDRFELGSCKRSSSALSVRGQGLLSTEEYKSGLFSVQGEASQLAVELLAPEPGETLIDLCAAPGGKSAAAAELMEDRGRVLAFDLYEKRAALIESSVKRLGIGIVTSAQKDASVPDEALFESAERVICDVPCSGLGVLRQKPEIKLREEPDIAILPGLQLKILENGAKYLKRGGRLLYSTCTVNMDENEGVTGAFMAAHSGYEKIYEEQILTEPGGPDGFYICILEKR